MVDIASNPERLFRFPVHIPTEHVGQEVITNHGYKIENGKQKSLKILQGKIISVRVEPFYIQCGSIEYTITCPVDENHSNCDLYLPEGKDYALLHEGETECDHEWDLVKDRKSISCLKCGLYKEFNV